MVNPKSVLAVELLNAPAVLARILLVLSRRRLTPRAMTLTSSGEWAALRLELDCPPAVAEHVAVQLRRIVEVRAATRLASTTKTEVTTP